METETQIIREKFHSLSKEDREAFLSSLSDDAFRTFVFSDMILRPDQLIPNGDWRYYILLTGRGFGKSLAASQWIANKIREGSKHIAIVGPTYPDLIKVMVPMIQERFSPQDRPKFIENKNVLRFNDKREIHCLTLENEARGGNYEYVWVDEIVKACDSISEKIIERFNTLDFAVRVGKSQILITTTPKPFPFIFEWQKRFENNDPTLVIKTGSILDNPYLAQSAKDALIERFAKTSFGEQELYGKLQYQNPLALFQQSWINDARITDPKNVSRNQINDLNYFFNRHKEGHYSIKSVRVVLDPAVSNGNLSDETGIIVGAVDFNNEMYILHDKTNKYTPDAWAKLTRDMFYHYKSHFPDTRIVAEVNQGGDLVKTNLTMADKNLLQYIDTIHASKGKLLRGEPVAAKYQRLKVHHIGFFEKLERQMTNYTGDRKKGGSPDSMDAMVHFVNSITAVPHNPKRSSNILYGW